MGFKKLIFTLFSGVIGGVIGYDFAKSSKDIILSLLNNYQLFNSNEHLKTIQQYYNGWDNSMDLFISLGFGLVSASLGYGIASAIEYISMKKSYK